ncbi:pyocin knob domain-containing protein [Campylobacter concisus]|uniref:pyocin knob domain-containing protein n=1 Tax=Campylobacter concisus TaxID=199 RepID=UPI001CA58852|nr:pyocin knob domain-containing protein [Campylobacter concisus]DAN06024.1 MAG TPA: putative tail fiber protein [Caudoviricetes sp.]
MANLKEENKWEEGIYQLEVTDPVVGGIDGISNKQAKQLANRTSYLKAQIEAAASNVNNRLLISTYNAEKVNFATKGEVNAKLDKTDAAADSHKLGGKAPSEYASANHNHDEIYLKKDSVAGQIPSKTFQLSTENLNDITTPGFYANGNGANSTAERNYPQGIIDKACTLHVMGFGQSGSGGSVVQMIYGWSGAGNANQYIYKREHDGGKWSPWVRVLTEGSIQELLPKAYVSFIGTTGEILKSKNILSVAKLGTGNYKISFLQAMSDNKYVCLISGGNKGVASSNHARNLLTYEITQGSFCINIIAGAGVGWADYDFISAIIY